MKKIELIPGTNKGGSESAFCLAAMSVAGVDAASLINAINENVVPFSGLLQDGKGLALLRDGDKASLVGVDHASPQLGQGGNHITGWVELTGEQRNLILEAARPYSEPGPLAGSEEIASEMFYAVQEAMKERLHKVPAFDQIEKNADLTLWCVHMLGPDELMAAPSHAEAAHHAAELNAALHGRSNAPDDVLCFAYAAPWPLTPENHAKDVLNWLKP